MGRSRRCPGRHGERQCIRQCEHPAGCSKWRDPRPDPVGGSPPAPPLAARGRPLGSKGGLKRERGAGVGSPHPFLTPQNLDTRTPWGSMVVSGRRPGSTGPGFPSESRFIRVSGGGELGASTLSTSITISTPLRIRSISGRKKCVSGSHADRAERENHRVRSDGDHWTIRSLPKLGLMTVLFSASAGRSVRGFPDGSRSQWKTSRASSAAFVAERRTLPLLLT